MSWIFIAVFGLIGLFVGSLLGTAAFRIADGLPVRGRSTCRVCLEPVATADLIPILSYVRLRGRCRNCAGAIGWQYPVLEFAMALVFALLAARTLFAPTLWFDIPQEYMGGLLVRDVIAAATLILLFAYDVRQFVVPDRISVPAIVLVILMNIALGVPTLSWVFGGLIGALFFGIQYAVSGGNLVGAGDIRAGALVGVILGFPGVFEAIVGAYMLACLVAFPLLMARKISPMGKAPFVSFLATSTIILLCTGPIFEKFFTVLLSG